MMHHYVEAAVLCGEKEHALKLLRDYWGEMVNEGADTFWELYNPLDPDESPYGGTIVNSYCHAWSCAPAYFLRKYFNWSGHKAICRSHQAMADAFCANGALVFSAVFIYNICNEKKAVMA